MVRLMPDQTTRGAACAATSCYAVIYIGREFAEAGGLMSYGVPSGRRLPPAAFSTGRPAWVESTKVELTINMKTAKALGLTFPLTLLGRADEVIE
jgi:putative tryptophan/tyrosine transport system substrate-binding protein